MDMEKVVHWTANIFGLIGVISGFILMFYTESSVIYDTKPNVGLGMSCIMSSILVFVILYSIEDILYYNRVKMELLEELVKNTKNDED